MAKQRIRNKNIQAFFAWVAEQRPLKTINNDSWETCAVGKFMPTIGLSLKGLDDAFSDRDSEISHSMTITEMFNSFSGMKFVTELENGCPDLYDELNHCHFAPLSYVELDRYIKTNFTK